VNCVIIEQAGIAPTRPVSGATLEQFLFHARIKHTDGENRSDHDENATCQDQSAQDHVRFPGNLRIALPTLQING